MQLSKIIIVYYWLIPPCSQTTFVSTAALWQISNQAFSATRATTIKLVLTLTYLLRICTVATEKTEILIAVPNLCQKDFIAVVPACGWTVGKDPIKLVEKGSPQSCWTKNKTSEIFAAISDTRDERPQKQDIYASMSGDLQGQRFHQTDQSTGYQCTTTSEESETSEDFLAWANGSIITRCQWKTNRQPYIS